MNNTTSIVNYELYAEGFYLQNTGANLLFALGEELVLKCKRVRDYHRYNADTIRIEFESSGDTWKDLALLTNALRISRNEAARMCAITLLSA